MDNDGGLIRRQLIERSEAALITAGELARAESDWQLLRAIGEVGRSVSRLSKRMVVFAAVGAAMGGHADHAMAIVLQWEDEYESTFDEPAPDDLRQQIKEAARHKLAG